MRIGNHISKDGDMMHIAMDRAKIVAQEHHIDLSCAQIFVIGPQSNKETLSSVEKTELATRAQAGMKIYAHASYLSNPWGAKSAFGISLVKRELSICKEMGFSGLVIHLARKTPSEIAKTIPQLINNDNINDTILFLEIESYKPLTKDPSAIGSAFVECTYETPYKLNELLAAIVKEGVNMKNIGICIDTAHLWAAGMDISTYHNMKKWLDEFEKLVEHGLLMDNVIFHLNDQIWTLGGGKDEHAPLLRGTMWGKFNTSAGNVNATGTDAPENSGLQAVIKFAAKYNTSLILERKPVKPIFKDANGEIINNIISDYDVLRLWRMG